MVWYAIPKMGKLKKGVTQRLYHPMASLVHNYTLQCNYYQFFLKKNFKILSEMPADILQRFLVLRIEEDVFCRTVLHQITQ